MGHPFYKIKQFAKCRMVNFHRGMLPVKYNTVLIVIHIGGILESPLVPVNGQRNDSVVLPGGMVQIPRVPFIFPAQQAFGISTLLCQLSRRNGFGIFFRFGEIDGDINLPIRTLHHPFHIFTNPVSADIIRILAELIEIIGSFLRALLVKFLESGNHLAGSRQKAVHQPCIQKIPFNHRVPDEFVLTGVIQQSFQRLLKRGMFIDAVRFLISVQPQRIQQQIGHVNPVRFLHQSLLNSILCQLFDILIRHVLHLLYPLHKILLCALPVSHRLSPPAPETVPLRHFLQCSPYSRRNRLL